ncbi:MAG: phage replisome organizer N-terminal domain-containing protein [Acidaminococcus provencensis]|jgi:predicted phage replisome organizer|uniref:phage replisome organizer N-terminal domain-containing protein n=1 Tax=Acidaminococcus provencensis TaxID=2058289 RepID=UPI0023EF6D67|nr:phage replisome organizer N-terminal domain-containing protein [Acidaminococcus provencensis]MCH4096357.1 phage replisome organizer N-terminal domain-containing protein [Acidaminococcus provencensis]
MAEGMKWIKLATNIFDQGKIKLIMRMPAGDTIIAIWLQILTHCGKECQDGILRISNEVPYTADMLAMIFGREPSTMRLALETFQQLKMIEVIDGVYCLPNWNKYQSPDKYEINRAKDRKRLQEWRKKQKEKAEYPQITASPENETFHETFPKRNETGTEIEEEVDKDKDIYSSSSCSSSKQRKVKDGHSAVSDFYTKNIRPTPSEYELNCLLDLADEYSDGWTIEALKETIKGGGRGLRYTEKILERWKVEGYKSRPAGKKRGGPSTQSQETIDQANEIPF